MIFDGAERANSESGRDIAALPFPGPAPGSDASGQWGGGRPGDGARGYGFAIFLIFVGMSGAQFHSYLFERRGFRALELGWLLCLGQAANILSPLVQVRLIRAGRGPRPALLASGLMTAAALALLPLAHAFAAMAALYFLLLFAQSALFPLFTAQALEGLRHRGGGFFFRLRSLGTAGYLAGCLVAFAAGDRWGLPGHYLVFAAAVTLATAALARQGSGPVPPPRGYPRAPGIRPCLRLLAAPEPRRLLAVLALAAFANLMAIGVQGNYIADRFGGGQRAISLAWIVSTACEIPWMLVCARMTARGGLRAVVLLGVLGTTFKLAGMAWAGDLLHFYLALGLHGLFYSGAITGLSLYLDRKFPPEARSSLQALAGVFVGGIPSALAGLAAGCLWKNASLHAVYAVAAVLGAGAGLYAWIRLPRLGGETGRLPD